MNFVQFWLENLKLRVVIMASSLLSENKRSRKVLSIKEKVDLINEHCKNSVPVKMLAKRYKIGTQTVYDILKNKDKIFKFFADSFTIKGLERRKTLKKAENPKVDAATYEWFRQERFRGVPISGQMIMEKAKFFHENLNIASDCVYSEGWLGKFKNRHGIHGLKAIGEKESADYEAATLFRRVELSWNSTTGYNASSPH